MKTLSQIQELNKKGSPSKNKSETHRERDLVQSVMDNQSRNLSQIYSKIQDRSQVASILKKK
jgi:hypothetical protein